MTSKFMRNLSDEMKKKPGATAAAAIIIFLFLVVGYSNWSAISNAVGLNKLVMDKATLNKQADTLADMIAARSVLLQRFERLQKRGGSFMAVEKDGANAVGIMVQDAVRAIANRTGFGIESVNNFRISKISDTMETCEVPFTGKDTWASILDFLAEVEISLPNFVWSSFSLTTKENEQKINFSGALKIVLVKDPDFIKVLSPIHEQIIARHSETAGNNIRTNRGLRALGKGLKHISDSIVKTDSDLNLADLDDSELDEAIKEYEDASTVDTAVTTIPAPSATPSGKSRLFPKKAFTNPAASDTMSTTNPVTIPDSGGAK